ncbi:MAG: pitrilysin family protein [Bacteroidetes bacterium]|nr:pitrilysin family protein [Bacteroidota bacterium]
MLNNTGYLEEYQYHQLKNGIRIVHKHAQSDVAHCGLIINAGSRDETKAENGIAHFIEHCIFKGTKKRNSHYILNRLDSVGGDLNAYTTKEETFVYASFLKEYYARCIELLADIAFNSTFPEKELAKEKEVVIEEIGFYKDNPSELIFDEFEQQLFENHPIGDMILGTPSNVKKFKPKHLLDFIHHNYNTDQMVICSVGNINFSKFTSLVERYFSDFEYNARIKQRFPFTGYHAKSVEKNKKTFQSHCIIGNTAYSLLDERKTALGLLNNILGGPASNTRLSLALRERNGLAYNVESNYTPYADTGLFAIYFGTDFSTLEKAKLTVMKELDKLRNTKLSSNQLHGAKKQLFGQLAISFESNLNELLSIGKSYLVYNHVDTIKQTAEKINKLTADELIEIANQIFNPDELSILTYKSK